MGVPSLHCLHYMHACVFTNLYVNLTHHPTVPPTCHPAGNKFLATIRECDALVHVVRCFDDDNIIHVDGRDVWCE